MRLVRDSERGTGEAMSDKLREAAELLCVSVSLASDGGVGQFLKALSGLRAALADSAPEPTLREPKHGSE